MPWPQRSGEMRHSSISVRQTHSQHFQRSSVFPFQFKGMREISMQFTCAVPLFRIQGKSTVTPTLKTANGISAFSMGTKAGEHFAFIDVWKWDCVDIWCYHCIQKQSTKEQCWHQNSSFFVAVTPPCGKITLHYINWYWLPSNQQCRHSVLELPRILSATEWY